jgi:hypothetical protein
MTFHESFQVYSLDQVLKYTPLSLQCLEIQFIPE